MGEAGEGAMLAWPDGDLQVGVWVEEHALLQTHRLEVWVDGWKNKRYSYKAFSGFVECYASFLLTAFCLDGSQFTKWSSCCVRHK